jgi:hypothetical protein
LELLLAVFVSDALELAPDGLTSQKPGGELASARFFAAANVDRLSWVLSAARDDPVWTRNPPAE